MLYLGTTGRSQHLSTALEAAARARALGVDVALRIVGSGSDQPRLRALARNLALDVELTGRVPRTAVGTHYAWADTAVVMLRDWPPFRWTVPSKLYEILAVGRHVSASVDGEAADLVRASRGGHVVPPQDPAALADLWARLAADRRLLDVGGRPRAWVLEHAHHDLLARRYLALLETVVAG
nr:glycosyltransferase [Litorihabitans aurantiacus]